MASVMSGGFGSASGGPNGNNGTQFLSMLSPPGNDLARYDKTKPYNQQAACIPQTFLDAMSVREDVYGEQGIPLEEEFDEDDRRSWHWVVYASVASTAASPPRELEPTRPSSKEEDARRSSATASRLPVGTVRMIPPPHGVNKYITTAQPKAGDKHPDADPPLRLKIDTMDTTHPQEPYVKLGRLAVLTPYRSLGLAKLLVNTALEWASRNTDLIGYPPSPTALEVATQRGRTDGVVTVWNGLVMIHAQVSVAGWWKKHFTFADELVNDRGEVEIAKEPRWMEEGIEHEGMWKRLAVDISRL
ncbi:hypothetical protein BDV95DRAFT_508166 [Massariosphaeria phaeospora]|uniref:N-acetyltransferase domain-containing protein n=1 Tax=Massariosphaeria phaeospora TaxID=100035 RepID=A0A7C8M1R5_9PLEO|nr:hypothetical protein BDV95DRAFT_508166 [Massariosphaeria phaeospora]